MKYAKLRDSLDGLFAYDKGCTDSGIHDEELREKVKSHLATLSDAEKKRLVDRITEDFAWGTEGTEEFFEWLAKDMDCTIPHRRHER